MGRLGCKRSEYDYSSRSFDPIPRDEEHEEHGGHAQTRPGSFHGPLEPPDWRLGKAVEGADAWWQQNKRMRCRQLLQAFFYL